jgi:hypothetical protein
MCVRRVRDQILDRDGWVRNAVDERRIGAVFQQSADQIGEQRLMCADRRVNPAGHAQMVAADHLLIKWFAHAMQALKFVFRSPGQGMDGGQCQSVMGGKLRINIFACRQQQFCAYDIRDVRVWFTGKNRKIIVAIDLGALDLRVPIGAFDQADHQPVAGAAGEVDAIL